MASRLGELIREHQDVLNNTGLAPTWAALLALAHKPRQAGGHISDESLLAASVEQADALQQQLQKQAHRASRYKDRARQLEVSNHSAIPAMPEESHCFVLVCGLALHSNERTRLMPTSA